jgi:hypothetical protein
MRILKSFLCLLIFAAIVSAQKSPELKQKARKMLVEIARETGQLNAEENRIGAAATAADLMWDEDEKAARALFQTALGELQNICDAINPPEGFDEMTRAEKADHFSKRYALAELRRDFLHALGGRDPQAALAAFERLKVKIVDEYDPLNPNELDLQLAAVMAQKDAEKSYAVAKRQLDANGLNFQFVEALKHLHKKNSQLAADLAKDGAAKIKAAKIRVPSETDTVAGSGKLPELNYYQITHFINSVSEMNRMAARDKEKKMQPALSAAEMKEIVELVTNAFLATIKPTPHSISQLMPEIKLYSPAMAQRIRLKIGAADAKQLDKVVESHSFYNEAQEKDADQLVTEAERAAPEVRDQRLSSAAYKALEEENAEKAREIAARIKDRKNHEYLFEQIKEALPLAAARRGDAAEVNKILSAVKSNGEKARVLTELALTVAAKGDRETAKKLLDERLNLLPANPKTYAELETIVRFAGAYSFTASENAFSILENAIAQTDEYINAGVKIDEFYIAGSSEANELLFSAINRQFLTHIPDSPDLIKNLARADFERTIALADKFQRPEIRLFARLRIVESLLDEDLVEKQKIMRQRIASEGEGH